MVQQKIKTGGNRKRKKSVQLKRDGRRSFTELKPEFFQEAFELAGFPNRSEGRIRLYENILSALAHYMADKKVIDYPSRIRLVRNTMGKLASLANRIEKEVAIGKQKIFPSLQDAGFTNHEMNFMRTYFLNFRADIVGRTDFEMRPDLQVPSIEDRLRLSDFCEPLLDEIRDHASKIAALSARLSETYHQLNFKQSSKGQPKKDAERLTIDRLCYIYDALAVANFGSLDITIEQTARVVRNAYNDSKTSFVCKILKITGIRFNTVRLKNCVAIHTKSQTPPERLLSAAHKF